jgi:hypothetical protein
MRRGRTTTHQNARQLPLRFRERAGGEGSSAAFGLYFRKRGAGEVRDLLHPRHHPQFLSRAAHNRGTMPET